MSSNTLNPPDNLLSGEYKEALINGEITSAAYNYMIKKKYFAKRGALVFLEYAKRHRIISDAKNIRPGFIPPKRILRVKNGVISYDYMKYTTKVWNNFILVGDPNYSILSPFEKNIVTFEPLKEIADREAKSYDYAMFIENPRSREMYIAYSVTADATPTKMTQVPDNQYTHPMKFLKNGTCLAFDLSDPNKTTAAQNSKQPPQQQPPQQSTLGSLFTAN